MMYEVWDKGECVCFILIIRFTDRAKQGINTHNKIHLQCYET